MLRGVLRRSPQAGYVRLPRLHAFVDGSVVQVYFNGEVVTRIVGNDTSAIALHATSGKAVLSVKTWQMDE